MHAKYEVFISYGSKVIAKVKVDNRQTDRQTNKQTDKQTDRQKGQKQYAPDHSIRGHKKDILRSSVVEFDDGSESYLMPGQKLGQGQR